MSEIIREMVEEIERMKDRLKEEIDKEERDIKYQIKEGYVSFEKAVFDRHKENMLDLLTYFREIPLLHLLSSPLIYAMVIPAIILDIALFLYQHVIFRVYKFEPIRRSDYIVFDRHYLGYLNPIERFNCLYCSYFNGLMHYASAITDKTELYFCPIRHAKKIAYKHAYYDLFLAYGDGDGYQGRVKDIRDKTREA